MCYHGNHMKPWLLSGHRYKVVSVSRNRGGLLLTLLQHEQVALHGVLADTLVLMRVLLHLPHQTLNLRPCALKTVPCLYAQVQEAKSVLITRYLICFLSNYANRNLHTGRITFKSIYRQKICSCQQSN